MPRKVCLHVEVPEEVAGEFREHVLREYRTGVRKGMNEELSKLIKEHLRRSRKKREKATSTDR
jgi:hypothetical protein